jgi:hypothetical protein
LYAASSHIAHQRVEGAGDGHGEVVVLRAVGQAAVALHAREDPVADAVEKEVQHKQVAGVAGRGLPGTGHTSGTIVIRYRLTRSVCLDKIENNVVFIVIQAGHFPDPPKAMLICSIAADYAHRVP